jgi:hypothetical protein
MKQSHALERIMGDTYERLQNKDLGKNARLPKTQAFSRKRKMPCPVLLMMILRGIHSQLQKATDYVFEQLKLGESVTRQAVSKARTNLDPEFIRELVHDGARIACSCDDLELFAGKYRLCAIDGSGVSLRKALFDSFGGVKGKATALASIAYDPLNDIIIDASLNRFHSGERAVAQANIEACEELSSGVPNVYIFDRGYPSIEFIARLMRRDRKFLFRASRTVSVDWNCAKGNGEWIPFDSVDNCFDIRVIKITLSTGEIETLVTNLDENELPVSQAGELYFKRWRVEEKLKELKEKLALEKMRGEREVVVLQDFYAVIWLSNIGSVLRWRTDARIVQSDQKKNLKYLRKTDVNRLLEKLRKNFFTMILADTDRKRNRLMNRIIADIARFPVDIKPGRSGTRIFQTRRRPCNSRNCAVD